MPSCIINDFRRFDAMTPNVWHPIASYIAGFHVLFWFPNGERGNGGFEAANAYPDDDGVFRTGWTHGMANAGSDFDFCEPPTLWMKIELPKDPDPEGAG